MWIQLRGRQRLLWLLPPAMYLVGAWCLAQRDLNIATIGAVLWLAALALAGYFLISAAGDAPSTTRAEKGDQAGDQGARAKGQQ